jgi:hypothetical protein
MKMHAKSSRSDQALKNLNQICDVEVILRLFCILPLFECVHMIIKVTQGQDVFLCDFVERVKFVQHKLYRLYCDPYKRFNDLTFDNLNAIENTNNENIPMTWFFDLNGGKDAMYLAFSCVGHKYAIY